jgi:hypothetical protein
VGDSGSWIVFVHSAVSRDSVYSGSVEARQLMRFVYCKLFRLGKLKSASGVGRSCFVCLRTKSGLLRMEVVKRLAEGQVSCRGISGLCRSVAFLGESRGGLGNKGGSACTMNNQVGMEDK